jgi:sugar/nucleoside kinase (ribokinase family)
MRLFDLGPLLDLWTQEGVSTRGVTVDREAPTGAYFVMHRPDGHVFSYLRAGSAASRMEPADLPDFIDHAAFVHASAISMAISSKAGGRRELFAGHEVKSVDATGAGAVDPLPRPEAVRKLAGLSFR